MNLSGRNPVHETDNDLVLRAICSDVDYQKSQLHSIYVV